MTDSISEAMRIKRETERELSRLLHSYEDSTGLPVSGIRMIRREGGWVDGVASLANIINCSAI